YKELGARNVTFIGQDYTWGHEVTLGAVETYKQAGGKVAKIIWNPIGTKDYGPTVASITPESDAVVAVVVGADRVRLFEAWFSFGMDKKYKIYGAYWMHQDVLPQMDDRAIGMIGNSLHYAAGLDTPENKAFVDAFAKKHKRLPSWFSESAYTASLWTRTAIEQIKGNVEDRTAFLAAMRGSTVKAPRGTLKLDDYDNPIQNVYITRIQKIKHPVVGEVLTNVPFKTYENVSQFWTWKPEEFLKRGPYKRYPVPSRVPAAPSAPPVAGRRARSPPALLMNSGVLQAINGISFAALLFLLASGFTLSFGLMRVVNMAHGAYYLLGGYIGLSMTR